MKNDTSWIGELSAKFHEGVSNIFVLHGNIIDYAVPSISLINYLKIKLYEMGMDNIAIYDIESGINFVQGERVAPQEGEDHLDDWSYVLSSLSSEEQSSVYIIRYPEFIFPNIPSNQLTEDLRNRFISFHKTINSRAFINSRNMVIFIAESTGDISDRLIGSNAKTVPIVIGYPNEQERLDMIEELTNTTVNPFKWEITSKQFSRMTAGLSRMHIEDVFLQAESRGTLEKAVVIKRKNELLEKEYGDVIEILDSEGYSFENFAGQQHIKDYHREVIIEPMLSGDSSLMPKGVLYVGPPGTGKTYFAKCLAGEAGATAVIVKMEKIVDKWVGESEKRFAKLLLGLEALAPLIAFVDEMDQAFHRGENESNSVMKNLFSMYIQFLSESSHRGNILWIGASNYPNRIDEALKRPGRFDKKIPFLPPEENERVELFKLHLKLTKYPVLITESEYKTLAKVTDKYTPAEIEGITVKVLELAKRKKKEVIDYPLVSYAISCVSTTQNSKIDEMVKIALDECNDKEFLPEKYRNLDKQF